MTWMPTSLYHPTLNLLKSLERAHTVMWCKFFTWIRRESMPANATNMFLVTPSEHEGFCAKWRYLKRWTIRVAIGFFVWSPLVMFLATRQLPLMKYSLMKFILFFVSVIWTLKSLSSQANISRKLRWSLSCMTFYVDWAICTKRRSFIVISRRSTYSWWRREGWRRWWRAVKTQQDFKTGTL